MERRDFIRNCISGLAGIIVGSTTGIPLFLQKTEAYAAQRSIELIFSEAIIEMVDFEEVYHWVFREPTLGHKFPGPVIFAESGDMITIKLTNELDEPHAFAIDSRLNPLTGRLTRVVNVKPILPGQSRTIRFYAPAPGTYIYYDPLNEPVNRLLGLHGTMVVFPKMGNTPYSFPPRNIQRLFNDFGRTSHFPGNPWERERTWIWHFHTIDPTWNREAELGRFINPDDLTNNYLPRYFTINGKSGFFAAHDPDISPFGMIGEPALIKTVNTGNYIFSPHVHGNHFYVLYENSVKQKNVLFMDTYTLKPMDRKDILIPFIRPPDIPDGAWPPVEELAQVLGGVSQSPLVYPMHCHNEPSQTAAGGNYPSGAVLHWEITGDLTLGIDFMSPTSVNRVKKNK
jgi:FtsP/CotA-like multicopper oxidase with cupredoxin domain